MLFKHWDGHTHSPYCPHGSTAELKSYIEAAVNKGFTHYSITEHAPLPEGFSDPTPKQDSAMQLNQLEHYLHSCQELKCSYAKDITILVGLEVDYIAGYEKEIERFINTYGPELDDSILSLHFMQNNEDNWICLDYSAEIFNSGLVSSFGSVDAVYARYYQQLLQAVNAELGRYKPRRIGHINLIEKFKRKYPSLAKDIWWSSVIQLLDQIKAKGYALDYNTAGLRKNDYQEVYPSKDILIEIMKRNIPLVYGSDAHHPDDVGADYAHYVNLATELNQL